MTQNPLKLSIMIPAYNSAKTIREALNSSMQQNYYDKEIVVVDDASTDKTLNIVAHYPGVRIVENKNNLGIGLNLANCFQQARGQYVLFLCADDVFVDPNVASDIVDIFDNNHKAGFIDRHYYQFVDGKSGPVTRVDDNNLFISSCCPSGMAFRKMNNIIGTNKIFIEMPSIVYQYLQKWRWVRLDYDPVAVRIHPLKGNSGNTGTISSYYTESPYKVYTDFLGKDFKYHPMLIQIKNRAPKILMDEIKLMLKTNPSFKKDPMFWLCAITALLVPGFILRRLSAFYRHRISRMTAYVRKRT